MAEKGRWFKGKIMIWPYFPGGAGSLSIACFHAPADKIALHVRNTGRGCYAGRTIQLAVPLKSEAGPNGAPFRMECITKL